MGKEIGRSFKFYRSKISTPTLKKPILSSSAAHTSYTSNLTRTIISSQHDNKESNTIQNTTDTSNTDDIHSCVTLRKQNTRVQDTSTPPRLTQLNTTLPIAPVELQKITKLPPVGEEYFCFQINIKYPHAAQCFKSIILNKAIDYILSIDKFEQKLL